jgi:hypothetical protein
LLDSSVWPPEGWLAFEVNQKAGARPAAAQHGLLYLSMLNNGPEGAGMVRRRCTGE